VQFRTQRGSVRFLTRKSSLPALRRHRNQVPACHSLPSCQILQLREYSPHRTCEEDDDHQHDNQGGQAEDQGRAVLVEVRALLRSFTLDALVPADGDQPKGHTFGPKLCCQFVEVRVALHTGVHRAGARLAEMLQGRANVHFGGYENG
jgi:hypothetical protein